MRYVYLFLLLLCCFFSLQFVAQKTERQEQQISEKVTAYYQKHLNAFYRKLETLNALEKSGMEEEQLKQAFLAARIEFKHSEALLCYLDNFETRKINGPNIVTNNYTYLTPFETVYPHGLQVIEDLIYNPGEGSREDLKKEIALLQELVQQYIKRNEKQGGLKPKDSNLAVWDAMRYELFRIESMSITGFDVPDSRNALPETKAALQSLKQLISFFKPLFVAKKAKDNYKKGIQLIDAAIAYTEANGQDFNTFDRLTFLRDYLHPFSSWVKQTSILLDYAYPLNTRPINAEAEHLFAGNSINMDYFMPHSNAQKIALGEKLFSDKILSIDNSRSCASCHIPSLAFADNLVKNTDITGKELLERNTPTLWNAGLQTRQFYDFRVVTLAKQALNVIHNEKEMGGSVRLSIDKIKTDPVYRKLFKDAYASEISGYNLLNAISCYVASLVSFNSRFDKYMRRESEDLSHAEKRGFNLFYGKAQCATCHFAPLFNGLVPPYFTETESEIIGVPQNAAAPHIIDPDEGRYSFSRLDLHKYSFKIPGIRNIELTAPYMHNGVFATLEEVVDFYNKGGGAGQGMDLSTQTLRADSLQLSVTEMNDLVAFMKSLTDTAGRRQ